jgi:DNA-binding winged helix-turn-helix (wHTH) protein
MLLRFGNFELHCDTGELRRSGALVRISDQTSRLLILFSHQAGRIVTRDEIRQTLWGDKVFVNFERSINFCINQVRLALGDSAQTPRYLETVPKRGYRFIAPVERHAGSISPPQALAETVAVVPFANTAGDPDIAWLGWAICESVAVDLHKLTQLRVVGVAKIADALNGLGLQQVREKDLPLVTSLLSQ